MKKITALFFVALLSGTIYAQDNSSSISKFRFGFKVAPSLAWLKPDANDYESDGSKIGFIYGLMMDYNFAKNYAVNVGLEVAYRGGKLKYDHEVSQNVTASGKMAYNIKYIELPLSIKMKTNEIGYMTYYGQFGLQPGLNIAAKYDYEYTINNPSAPVNSQSDKDVDIVNEIVDFNFSLLFGIGTEYRISGNTSIMAGLQFSNGFTDLIKSDDPSGTPIKAISNYISLNVGIFF